jgi:hypothetical protein
MAMDDRGLDPQRFAQEAIEKTPSLHPDPTACGANTGVGIIGVTTVGDADRLESGCVFVHGARLVYLGSVADLRIEQRERPTLRSIMDSLQIKD